MDAPETDPTRPRKKRGFSLTELLIVLSIIGGLAAVAVPNFRAARERSNTRACYANQKTVVGAMEMYCVDKTPKRQTIDPEFFRSLQAAGYLRSIPQDPGCGPGSETNYKESLTGNGIICLRHGSIQ